MNRKECIMIDEIYSNTDHGAINRTITVLPALFLPNIRIYESGHKYYCGPQIILLKEFVKYEKVL